MQSSWQVDVICRKLARMRSQATKRFGILVSFSVSWPPIYSIDWLEAKTLFLYQVQINS
jgi:hypothetical protein